MKTAFSIFTLFVLLFALLAAPVAPVAGQDGDDTEARCERLRVALSCNCLAIVTPDTVIYMRPLTDEERASYLALYDELGCAAFEPTEEPEPEQEATPKPKRTAVPQVPSGDPPAPAAATPRDPACRLTVIPDDAVLIELVEDTRLLWAPDAEAQTEYTVPAGTTAWQIALDESGEYATLAWTCSVVIYVPVDHTVPARAD